MKTASILIQAIALTACLAVQTQGFSMPGVRRALQTMAQVSMVVDHSAEEAAGEG